MYAKLSSTITRSSIWREPPATRVVWIALLALANQDGFVKGVEAWLAGEANVSREECRAALETFMAPDPESQDQDYGGRRLEKLEGGWLVLNYKKYRDLRTKEQVLAAERQQRKRKRDKGLDNSSTDEAAAVTGRHAPSRSVTAIASASESASEAVEVPRAREAVSENATPAKARPRGLAQQLAAAANRAFDERFGPNRNPITSGTAANLLEAIEQHGIDAAFAVQAVYEAALKCEREPRSLHYFTAGVVERWEREQARGDAAAFVPGAPARRSRGRALAAGVPNGDRTWSGAALWDLFVRGGLTAPMQSRDALAERVEALVRDGAVADGVAFLALVVHVKPWALAEIKFAKTREDRLQELLASFRTPSQGAA